MNGFILGLLSAVLLVVAVAIWFRRLNGVALEGRRGMLFAMCLVATIGGIAALAREPGWLGGAMAILAIAGGTIWIALGLLAGQSKQTPNVIVGSSLPSFSAPNHQGETFEIESLRGHPVLIKLFRGHW